MSERRRGTRGEWLLLGLALLCVICALALGAHIVWQEMQLRRAERQTAAARGYIAASAEVMRSEESMDTLFQPKEKTRRDAQPQPLTEVTALPAANDPFVIWPCRLASVDFDGLRSLNGDVCAWIMSPDQSVSYPVAQGRDNEWYLSHTLDGQSNASGTVFLDAASHADFSDGVSWLFGHNMRDHSMFAFVHDYRDEQYARSHPTLLLLTPQGDYQLDVFACCRLPVRLEKSWYVSGFSDADTFDAFAETIKACSEILPPFLPTMEDRIVALCTCTGRGHEQRNVLFTRMTRIQYAEEAQACGDEADEGN